MAMAMLGALASTNVVALGLGEIELKSALNQPLNAEVELLSATESELGELKVAVGSAQAFANAGIERPLFLNKLNFNVTRNPEGKPVVLITSREVVREPFLDFLLEMSWSKGRLVREYTVLVDPPVTMPAPAPVTRAPASRQAPAPAPVVSSAPARRVTHTAQRPPVSVSPGEYGPTRRNDTLWGIAQNVRPDTGVSVEQTMLGLLRANPEAFVDNNINNLKAGYVLRVPSREELTSMSRGDARREARAQYAEWRAARGQSPSVSAQQQAAVEGGGTAVPSAGATAAAESHLQLVAPEAAEQAGGTEGANNLEGVQRELMMANEALEAQRRQSEEMSGRLSVLEEQIVNMQRLIQLKDNELARLQAQGAAEAVVPAVEEAVPAETAPDLAQAGEAGTDGMAEAVPGMDASGMESPVEAGPEMAADMPAEVVAAEAGTSPAEAMAADSEIAAPVTGDLAGNMEQPVEVDTAAPVADEEAVAEAPPPVEAPVAEPVAPVTATPTGFVDRLLANPLWLGAGGVVLALLAFFGLRRKRGVETEFQESILQAAQKESSASDSEIVTSQPASTDSKTPESSLLSEFAVSDMGSIRNDGEADPLAEADVYLAYGRYKQAEELIKDALEKDSEREDLNLKLLEVFMAGKNQTAFDEHAQGLLAKLGNSNDQMWEKVADMGRELSPDNPLYQAGAEPAVDNMARDMEEELDSLAEEFDLDMDSGEEPVADAQEESKSGEEGLDFDLDLSFDPGADAEQPDSAEFTPPDVVDDSEAAAEPELNVDMDSVEPGTVEQDNALEFDAEGFDMETAEATEEEPQGDGELADLDEVSTKLDLARAYIDMGDPDGARSILDEVMEEGSDNQKDEARDIMAQMS